MVRYSTARLGMLLVCVFTLAENTNWAIQLFNLHVVRFNMLRRESGERQSFLLCYNHTCVHTRPLEDRSK